jgi:hypothetical protein
MAFVAERIAPHEKVRVVEFIDQIPKSASGKLRLARNGVRVLRGARRGSGGQGQGVPGPRAVRGGSHSPLISAVPLGAHPPRAVA